MSKIRLHGTSSGYTDIAPTAAAGNNTLTAPTGTGTLVIQDGAGAIGITSVQSTKGNFTGNVEIAGDVLVAADIKHTGDTDTKIYFDTDTIKFDTAGSERFRIDSAGDVGIGTNGYGNIDPTFPLEICKYVPTTAITDHTSLRAAAQLCLHSSNNVNNSRSALMFSGALHPTDGCSAGIVANHENVAEDSEATSLSFFTTNSETLGERLRITKGGDVLIGGHSSAIEPMSYESHLEIHGTSTDSGLTILRYSADTVGPQIVLGKSRNASIGSNSTLSENDGLGQILFSGTDTDWEPGASIQAAADGEWLSGGDNTDTPGRLTFHTTPNGSDDLSERMRICANGTITFRIGAPYSIYPTAGTSTGECGFQFKQTAGFARGFALIEERGDSNGMDLIIAKSRDSNGSGGVGSINSGDTIGFIRYTGADGAKQITAGGILVWNTGTVATDRVAGRMGFYTHPDSTSNHASRMVIDESGNIGAPNQGTNIYNASDERVKENMVELTDGLSKVKQLKPISFTWKDNFCESENGLTQYGFGAQTTQAVDELLVQPFGEGDIEFNGETIENPLRVNEKFIIPLLVKAIQEQQEQIETLKARLDAAGL